MILKDNGELFVFGNNGFGQLGSNNTSGKNIPHLLMSDSNIRQIACGPYNSMILKSNGEVLVFGDNTYGQLGLGNYDLITVPTILIQDPLIYQIACGGIFSMILKNNGNLFAIGFGPFQKNQIKKYPSPVLLLSNPNIKSVACGQDHSLILMNNGEIYGLGDTRYGKLGKYNKRIFSKPKLITRINNVNEISCGWENSLILTNSGKLIGMGNHKYLGKQMNKMTSENKFKHVSYDPIIIKQKQDTSIKQIFCGPNYGMILHNNGNIYRYGTLNFNDDKEISWEPVLLDHELLKEKVLIMNNITTMRKYEIWNPQIHSELDREFKNNILTFLLSLKETQKKTNIKIPKFVLFEIIKHNYNQYGGYDTGQNNNYLEDILMSDP